MLKSMGQNAVGLGIFAVLTAGVIAVTQQSTAEKIAANVDAARIALLNEVIPPESHNNNLLEDSLLIEDRDLLGGESSGTAYRVRQDNLVTAIILPAVAPDGYSGKIYSMVGIDEQGNIIGARVITHNETPGLGDKVEAKKSDWIQQFNGRSLLDPLPQQWGVKKDGGDFDQLTGATITPRAVTASIRKALEYFQAHKAELFEESDDSPAPAEEGENDGNS